jgi:hypothetical protein
MARPMPNFVILDGSLPDVGRLVAAMLKARQAIETCSWSHPQEPTTEEWWADVLADPRAQIRKRRGSEQAVSRTFYRLADEPRATVLSPAANATGKLLSDAMSCSLHTARPARCRACSRGSPRQAAPRSAHSGTAAASTMSTPSRGRVTSKQS